MFNGKGKPGYYIDNVLYTLPSFMSDSSELNNFIDNTKHRSGLDGNMLPGKTLRYYNPSMVFAIQDLSDAQISFFKDRYNTRKAFIFVPHIDLPLIQFNVYVQYCERVDIGNKDYQNCLQVVLHSNTVITKILTADELRVVNNNTIITT